MTKDRKNVIWNMVGATFNAFNSLLFSIAITRINGESTAGVFIYCFATACLFYFVGNYCGRTFQVTDISKKNSDTDYIYNRIITCVIMVIISIGFAIIKGYDLNKALLLIILCVYKSIEAFSESLYAIIQRNGELYKVGISMFLKAIISFLALLILDIITNNLIIASLSIVIVNILFIIIYDRKNIRKIELVKTKFTFEANKRILKSGFFTFVLTFLATYLINSPRYAIDDLLESNAQTIFGIIIMPASFMGLLGQYIIQPTLTKISDSIDNKNYNNLKQIIIMLTSFVFIIGIVVIIIANFFEEPVLKLVYGIELKSYHLSMMIIILGSICYSLSIVLSAVLVAMRKTLIQAISYGAISIISTIMAYEFVKLLQIKGASITYLVTMFAISLVFIIYIIYNMKKYKKEWQM